MELCLCNFAIVDRLANRPFLLKFFDQSIQWVLLENFAPLQSTRWGDHSHNGGTH